MDTSEASINNVQVDSDTQGMSALASIMETMAITDVEDISMENNSE